MNEKPLFYQGQRVVFVGVPHGVECPNKIELIEGKSYYIVNPNYPTQYTDRVFIALSGLNEFCYLQTGFIPYDEDQALEDEIKTALNEGLKIKNL